MHSYHNLEFAMCGVRILILILFVSFASYYSKSRLMFALGTIGCFLGHVVPMSQRTSMTFESSLYWTSSHILAWGLVGGFLGCCISWAISNQFQKQFSIQALLISTAMIAFLIAMIKFFWIGY